MRKGFYFFSIFAVSVILASCAAAPETSSNNGGSSSSAAPLAPGVYVTTAGNDTNVGTNAALPLKTIQVALSNAFANGLTNVYFAAGIYKPGSGLNPASNGVMISNNNMNLYGGFSADFSARTGKSELDGTNILFHVIFLNTVTNILIDGFVLRNAIANDSFLCGPGIYFNWCSYCSLTNSVISNNSCLSLGGGVMLDTSSRISISADISSNLAGSCGGGIYVLAGFSNIINCNIRNNTAPNIGGGGIYIDQNASQIMVFGTVVSNTSVNGGGIYNDGDFIILTNIIVAYNSASLGGGIDFESCYGCSVQGLVTSNTATNIGGGIMINYGTNMNINTQVLYNRSTNQGGGIWAGNYCSGIQVTGQIMYNYTGQYGGGIMIQRCSNFLISADLSCNRGGNFAGGALFIDASTNVQVLSSVMTNNSGNGIIAFGYYNKLDIISNCMIGGTNGSANFAIVEAYDDLTGQYLFDNTFVTNALGWLYCDYNYWIENYQVSFLNSTNVNGTNFTGAAGVGGNKVTNR